MRGKKKSYKKVVAQHNNDTLPANSRRFELDNDLPTPFSHNSIVIHLDLEVRETAYLDEKGHY